MAAEDWIELKFRLFDGTDIGPNKYDPSTTVSSLKEVVLSGWPQGKFGREFLWKEAPINEEVHSSFTANRSRTTAVDCPSGFTSTIFVHGATVPYSRKADKPNGPKSITDLKLINGGKILENHRTLAESRVPFVDLPGGVITMHVVVRPPLLEKHSERKKVDDPKQSKCACSIL